MKPRYYKQEAEAIPLTCWPWVEVSGTYEYEIEGKRYGFGPMAVYFRHNFGVAYWDFVCMEQLARTIYEYYGTPERFQELYGRFLEQSNHLEAEYLQGKIPQDPQKLQEYLLKIGKILREVWQVSLFIDAFDTGVDQEEITRLTKQHNLTKEEVIALATPSGLTFHNERKLAFLELIEPLFSQKKVNTKEWVAENEEVQRYHQIYDYVHSNYATVNHLTNHQTAQEAEGYLTDFAEYTQELARLRDYSQSQERAIQEVLRVHGLAENPLWFFQELTYWREYRKKVILMGIHILDRITQKISQMTKIEYGFLGTLRIPDLAKEIVYPHQQSELWQREQGLLWSYNEGKFTEELGESAQLHLAEIEKEYAQSSGEVIVLTGQTAMQGYAQGIARIITSQADFARFKEGDILVTSMTRPDFVPLMRKAAGIVTNEGGITSHAAIVARELGVPCIIGTKFATQHIPDGALVEVRANHGTVRVIG